MVMAQDINVNIAQNTEVTRHPPPTSTGSGMTAVSLPITALVLGQHSLLLGKIY